jgi:protein-tyrosine phosphatase
MTMKCTDPDLQVIPSIDYVTLRISDNFKSLPEATTGMLREWADTLHQRSRTDGVLIHCYGGENRSCLLAGMVLVRGGLSGPDAVRAILRVRPTALYNPVFKKYLLGR